MGHQPTAECSVRADASRSDDGETARRMSRAVTDYKGMKAMMRIILIGVSLAVLAVPCSSGQSYRANRRAVREPAFGLHDTHRLRRPPPARGTAASRYSSRSIKTSLSTPVGGTPPARERR